MASSRPSQSHPGLRVQDIELNDVSNTGGSASLEDLTGGTSDLEGSSLPQADGGKDAWLFLAGCFTTEAFVWGFPLSFGIFQSYYSTHAPFSGDTRIATIGTTATGLMYLCFPLVISLAFWLPYHRHLIQITSLLIMTAGLIGSSFATTVPQLIATQGVMFALGGTAIYTWLVVYLDQWFVRRKGLAFGIVWAGTGFAGVVIPPVLQALLDRYGHQVALRAWAAVSFILLCPTLYFVKPRLPPSRARKIDLKFLTAPSFVILQLANIVQSLGFFMPTIYLPTYTTHLGGSTTIGAATLLVFNIAFVAGSVVIGALSDRWHVTTCQVLCAIGSTLSVFLLWGLTRGLPILFLFAVGYGFFAGSVSSTWSGVMRLVASKTARAEPTMVIGFLAAGRGIGNIVSGPLSERLLQDGQTWGRGMMGLDNSYGPVIIFVGVTAMCGGFTIFGRTKRGLL